MKYFKLYENWNGESLNEAKLLGPNSKDNFQPAKLQTFHRYVEGSSKQDPAKGMLRSFFGDLWTERYINNILFDLQ